LWCTFNVHLQSGKPSKVRLAKRSRRKEFGRVPRKHIGLEVQEEEIMKYVFSHVVLGLAVSVAISTITQAATVVQTSINSSTMAGQNLNGTTNALSTVPAGSTWVFGAGWNWSQPTISYPNPAPLANSINMNEEQVALGVSIASVARPAMTISTTVYVGDDQTNLTNTIGLGFWTTMIAREDAAHSYLNEGGFNNTFVGLVVNEQNDTISLYANGALQGSAVNLGFDLVENLFVDFTYDVDTTTGDISNVSVAGNVIPDFSTSVFTTSATSVAGFLTGSGSRGSFSNFTVSVVPEPATVGLASVAAGAMLLRRRKTV
jgi:hypothetical protein